MCAIVLFLGRNWQHGTRCDSLSSGDRRSWNGASGSPRFSGGSFVVRFRPGIDLAALCGPRGLGKSSLSGELLSCALDPDGPLFEAGSESVLLAGSLDQARAAFRFLRARCPESRGFKYTDSGQRVSRASQGDEHPRPGGVF